MNVHSLVLREDTTRVRERRDAENDGADGRELRVAPDACVAHVRSSKEERADEDKKN